MSDLFTPAPQATQWRRHADPLLWGAMRDHLDATSVPETTLAVERLLIDAFEQMAMLPLPRLESEGTDDITRSSFPYGHSPLSEVPIDVDLWASTLIPMLTERARPSRLMSA